MVREMREEDSRSLLVYFTDSRNNKDVRGFGIDLGPGLPKNTRLVSFGWFFDGSVRNELILLDKNNPFVTVQKLSSADFLVRARSILGLARTHRLVAYAITMPDLPRDVPFSEIDFNKDADTIAERLEETYTIFTLDWLNTLIVELIQKGVTDF